MLDVLSWEDQDILAHGASTGCRKPANLHLGFTTKMHMGIVSEGNAATPSVFLIRTAFWCHLQPCMESCANHPSLKNRTFRSTALPPGRLVSQIPAARIIASFPALGLVRWIVARQDGHVTSNLAWYSLHPTVPPLTVGLWGGVRLWRSQVIKAVFQEIAVVFVPQNYSSTHDDLQLRASQAAVRLDGPLQSTTHEAKGD